MLDISLHLFSLPYLSLKLALEFCLLLFILLLEYGLSAVSSLNGYLQHLNLLRLCLDNLIVVLLEAEILDFGVAFIANPVDRLLILATKGLHIRAAFAADALAALATVVPAISEVVVLLANLAMVEHVERDGVRIEGILKAAVFQ